MPLQVRASSSLRKEKASAPSPRLAAILMVSRLVQAIHIGGCGFCTGLGMTLRHGNLKERPSKPGYGVITIMLAICSAASSDMARFSLAGISKPPSSSRVAPSPMPSSARPLETRSSMAIASAVRAGWL